MFHRTSQGMRGTSPSFSFARSLCEQVLDLLLLQLLSTFGPSESSPGGDYCLRVHGKSNRTFKSPTLFQLRKLDSCVQDPGLIQQNNTRES